MLMLLCGAALASAFWYFMLRRKEAMRQNQIKGIYHGYGAPDENGNVGWYRDNRHGSPFTHPDSPWAFLKGHTDARA